MRGNQIAVIAAAGIVAFGAAFGVAKSMSSPKAAAAASQLQSVVVAAAPEVGSITPGSVPALRPPKRAHKPAAPKPDVQNLLPSTPHTPVTPKTPVVPHTPITPRPQPKPQPKPQPPKHDTVVGQD